MRRLAIVQSHQKKPEDYVRCPASDLARIREVLGIHRDSPEGFVASLPFSVNDTTAGCENEFQAVVIGNKGTVDLPIVIRDSNYYKNAKKRAAAGDTSRRLITALENYIDANPDNVWENSWVRFRRSTLSPYANEILNHDLLEDKGCRTGPRRKDSGLLLFHEKGEPCLRVPVSYFLKLSLADAVSTGEVHPMVRATGERCMGHFLNDNTSPETFSFYPIPLKTDTRMGRGLAGETLKRFLLCQALAMYGNTRFHLRENGQQALVYFAPHPPIRQKLLNGLVSDSFYRELFMSPCLSGWDKGEEKHRYMHLCHQVLSRSQLNAVAKLKEANIIARNLVVLPNLSNISLANNGTHVSLGSRKLTSLLADRTSGFGPEQEKYLGDLAIKIAEHFLPLFVGSYSAAPYRLDFSDFHPELALGFLPHELDFTHLRMMWRRWKKKAHLKFFGQPITPFGPEWLDRLVRKVLQLKGDFVVDFRLIDYLVALMSTEESPALDGNQGNDTRLRQDLAQMGVFDANMSIYLLLRLRQFSTMGFSGFEGRHYSVFESITDDLAHATNLQTLITALAFKYILGGEVTHGHIPDSPFIESERRQVFFGTAIGIPTFFVRKNTENRFMAGIIRRVKRTRLSRRYPGYVRVHNVEYRKALVEMLRDDAADIVELLGLGDTLADLERRVQEPKRFSAAGRLTQGILDQAGAVDPLKLSGQEFNMAAERYYLQTLRRRHMAEAYDVLLEDCRRLEREENVAGGPYRKALKDILGDIPASGLVMDFRRNLPDEDKSDDRVRRLIHLLLLTIHQDMQTAHENQSADTHHAYDQSASIH